MVKTLMACSIIKSKAIQARVEQLVGAGKGARTRSGGVMVVKEEEYGANGGLVGWRRAGRKTVRRSAGRRELFGSWVVGWASGSKGGGEIRGTWSYITTCRCSATRTSEWVV